MTSTTDPRQPAPHPAAAVALRHDTPDGAHHFDLLFENPDQPAGQGALIAFRTAQPPEHWPSAEPVELERIADHRRQYLDYEGEISGGRGRVTRVGRFTFYIDSFSPTRFAGRLAGEAWSGRLDLALEAGGRWVGVCLVE